MGGDSLGLLSAGLPEIEGSFYGAKKSSNEWEASGAFYVINTSGTGYGAGNVSNPYISFNASRSNVIYGKSDTVQPPAILLLPQIKYQYLICAIKAKLSGKTLSLLP